MPPATSSAPAAAAPAPVLAEGSTDITAELLRRDIMIDGIWVDTVPSDDQPKASVRLFRLLRKRWGGRSPLDSPGSFFVKLNSTTKVGQAAAVIRSAVTAGYPRITVLVGGEGRRFGAPFPPPSPSPEHRTLTAEAVYVARADEGFELTWLRQPPDATKPEVVRQITAAGSHGALAAAFQEACGAPLSCNNVLIEAKYARPFSDVYEVLTALDGVVTREWGPVVMFGDWDRDNDGQPKFVVGPTHHSGLLLQELIQETVKSRYAAFRACYEEGLARDPQLTGRVAVRVCIGTEGEVCSTSVLDSTDLEDPKVVACVAREHSNTVFPPPLGGTVTFDYPILFSPAPAK